MKAHPYRWLYVALIVLFLAVPTYVAPTPDVADPSSCGAALECFPGLGRYLIAAAAALLAVLTALAFVVDVTLRGARDW